MKRRERNQGMRGLAKQKVYLIAFIHCAIVFAFFFLISERNKPNYSSQAPPPFASESFYKPAAPVFPERAPSFPQAQVPSEPKIINLPNGGFMVLQVPQPVMLVAPPAIASAPKAPDLPPPQSILLAEPTIASAPAAAGFSQQPTFFQKHQEPEPTTHSRAGFPSPKRLVLNHNSGWGEDAGIGFGTNCTTLEMFLASNYRPDHFYPFIDLKAHRFDNDTFAADIGVGGRYVPDSNREGKRFCEMLGFNVYYDWRQGFLESYNQLGVGLEVLGRWWDFRANGYFPVGRKTFERTCTFNYDGGFVITNENIEITTYGFNAEVGWLALDYKGFLLYAAAGPYYLTRKCNCFNFNPILGGEIRLRPQYRDYFAVDLRFSYDSTFHSIFETTFIVSVPLYQIKGQNERPCDLSDRQIYQPIERLDIMTLSNKSCWQQNF